uniref:Uncharacterized protein n=1 Tax=feces metagenome TaxID=1861841 RepID=A0A7M2QN14_9ZZZZ
MGGLTGSSAAKRQAKAAERAAEEQTRLAQEQAKESARQAANQAALTIARQNAVTAIEEQEQAQEAQDVEVDTTNADSSLKRRRSRYSDTSGGSDGGLSLSI